MTRAADSIDSKLVADAPRIAAAEHVAAGAGHPTVLPWRLLADLRCPCCAGDLVPVLRLDESADGLRHGILRCDCYEYPVLDGIAVLRQIGPVSSTRNEAVERLKGRRVDQALEWLLENGTAAGVPTPSTLRANRGAWSRLRRRMRRTRAQMTRRTRGRYAGPIPLNTSFQSALRAARTPGYADYLFHRFANPSLLGALPPLLVLGSRSQETSRRRVVDLLCGAGHMSAVMKALYPRVRVVEADSDFVNLFLSRRLSPADVSALCLDAELPLPFRDGTVDGVFCLDGLHYVRSKRALLAEIDRIISESGTWVFAHMHNALVSNINPGAPLTPSAYAGVFSFGTQRLLSESDVLQQFQTGGSLDLTDQPSLDALTRSNAVTLVGSRTESLWRRHDQLDDALGSRQDLVALNPIYALTLDDDDLVLRTHWPSESLRAECTGPTPVLPEIVRVPLHVLSEPYTAAGDGRLSPRARALIRAFVLVSLPACYPRIELPSATRTGAAGPGA